MKVPTKCAMETMASSVLGALRIVPVVPVTASKLEKVGMTSKLVQTKTVQKKKFLLDLEKKRAM